MVLEVRCGCSLRNGWQEFEPVWERESVANEGLPFPLQSEKGWKPGSMRHEEAEINGQKHNEFPRGNGTQRTRTVTSIDKAGHTTTQRWTRWTPFL